MTPGIALLALAGALAVAALAVIAVGTIDERRHR